MVADHTPRTGRRSFSSHGELEAHITHYLLSHGGGMENVERKQTA